MDIEDESQSLFDTDVNDASEEEFDRYRDSQDAAEEIEAYDKCENDVSVAFAGWKRLPCFVHTLQLVVKIFETSPCFKSTLRKVMAIAKKVNKSCKATERLITLAGKKLTKNCVTRWDSTFYMLSHFLEVKDHLIVVLDELEWDSLTPMQWRQISVSHDTDRVIQICITRITRISLVPKIQLLLLWLFQF